MSIQACFHHTQNLLMIYNLRLSHDVPATYQQLLLPAEADETDCCHSIQQGRWLISSSSAGLTTVTICLQTVHSMLWISSSGWWMRQCDLSTPLSGLLRDRLHWLRRVGCKLCLLVFRAVHGTEPDYITELCWSNAEDTARSRLFSVAHGDLQVPCSKTNFAVTMPASWNRPPATIRSSDAAEFQEPTESSLFLLDHFFFSIHLEPSHHWIGLPCYGA